MWIEIQCPHCGKLIFRVRVMGNQVQICCPEHDGEIPWPKEAMPEVEIKPARPGPSERFAYEEVDVPSGY